MRGAGPVLGSAPRFRFTATQADAPAANGEGIGTSVPHEGPGDQRGSSPTWSAGGAWMSTGSPHFV